MQEPLPKYYTDTHIPKSVAVQLRLHGLDIVRCEDVGLGTADDVTHLRYASGQGRSVVTQDTDFFRLHRQWQESGLSHAGIFIVPAYLKGEAMTGVVVRFIEEYHDMIVAGAGTFEADLHNQIIFIS